MSSLQMPKVDEVVLSKKDKIVSDLKEIITVSYTHLRAHET